MNTDTSKIDVSTAPEGWEYYNKALPSPWHKDNPPAYWNRLLGRWVAYLESDTGRAAIKGAIPRSEIEGKEFVDNMCEHRSRFGWQSDPCAKPTVPGTPWCEEHQPEAIQPALKEPEQDTTDILGNQKKDEFLDMPHFLRNPENLKAEREQEWDGIGYRPQGSIVEHYLRNTWEQCRYIGFSMEHRMHVVEGDGWWNMFDDVKRLRPIDPRTPRDRAIEAASKICNMTGEEDELVRDFAGELYDAGMLKEPEGEK